MDPVLSGISGHLCYKNLALACMAISDSSLKLGCVCHRHRPHSAVDSPLLEIVEGFNVDLG